MSKVPVSSPASAGPVVHRCDYRVIYRDTDKAGHVYYGNYLALFEIGRTSLLRGLGGSYRSWEERGYLLPVRDCTAEYHRPARYDDVLIIETTLIGFSPVRMAFSYRILRLEGVKEVLLTTGTTSHAFLRADGRVSRDGLKLLGELGLRPDDISGTEAGR